MTVAPSSPTLELYVEQGKLRYRVRKGSSSAALLQFLSEHKADLVSILTSPVAGSGGSSPGPASHNSHNPQNRLDLGDSEDCGNSGLSFGHVGDNDRLQVIGTETAPQYLVVRRPEDLMAVRAAIDNTPLVGLDMETTGLDPRIDRIRLLSLATGNIDGGTLCYLVDCFEVDPAPLFDLLAKKEVVIHNALFDMGFLARLGFVPGVVYDTMLLARLLAAGTNQRCKLADCVERELKIRLDKTEQKSHWSGKLTPEQLAYAARDAAVLIPLKGALAAKIAKAKLEKAATVEQRCLPAVIWMGRQGVGFDRGAWQALSRAAAEEAQHLRSKVEAMAPQREGVIVLEGSGCNWDSPQQVKEALRLAGCEVQDTKDDTLAAAGHPLADLLRQYRSARKVSGTYGTAWLKHVAAEGRVYTSWHQCGTRTGRMSSGEPNLQNLPRDPRYRRCFMAPPGRVLVKADYSQIELRIAAKVSGDEMMLAAYRDGLDLHTLTAQRVLGVAEVSKEQRQLAKAINFGLLYGMGAEGFRAYALAQYGLRLTKEEAGRYRQAFFAAYPGLRRWHRSVPKATMTTRTLVGRWRQQVERYTEKLNTPVQGTGADGLKLALALLWERREQCPGAFPVLAVHDEIVVECAEDQAEAVAAWLTGVMVDALAPLLDPVPVEVEVKIGRTWAGD
jgi:DNA polymerase-1